MKNFEEIEKSLGFKLIIFLGSLIFVITMGSFLITDFPSVIRQMLIIPGVAIVFGLCILSTWKTYIKHNRLPNLETAFFFWAGIIILMILNGYFLRLLNGIS